MRALFIMHYFEIGIMVYMVYKVLPWTDVFSISHKMVCSLQHLLVVLGSKQEGTLKLVNHKQEDWASIQFLTLAVLQLSGLLCRDFKLFFNENKQDKLRNALSVWYNFCEIWLEEIFVNFPMGFRKNFLGYTFFSGYQFLRKVQREKSSTQGKLGNRQRW